MLFLGEYTTACRVLRDEFLIDGPVHSVGNEAVNIAYRFGRQAFWLVLRFFSLYSAALAHAVVELLQVVGGELVQFDCSDRIVFDTPPIRFQAHKKRTADALTACQTAPKSADFGAVFCILGNFSRGVDLRWPIP